MPIIKSAKKRVRQAEVRHGRNLATKRAIRTETKALEVAIAAGDAKTMSEQYAKVQSALDTAVKKNVIHRNKAARNKSSLNARVKAAVGGAKPAAKAKKPAAKKATTTKKAAPKAKATVKKTASKTKS